LLALRSPRYTHDILVHATIPNLIGINTALEVDLTGQINAEIAEGRHIGMVGGHGDFMRGCLKSSGGRAIIALDADIVVTEFGIAELRGSSVSERARQLIAIAHPDFRRSLSAAAAAGLM
jgi:acetyl-CoA hydrolase